MPAKSPNILIVQADQMAAPALPFYGHPVVRAPHMAALAERGLDVVRDGSVIVARDVADADYDTIRDVVADSGARLRRLTPRRHTLTEMFQGERS